MQLSVQFSFGQDKVHLHIGKVYEGTVVTIEPDLVTISQGENKPTRSILKSEIKAIVYLDGSVDTFYDYMKSTTIQPILYHPAVVKSPRTAALLSLLVVQSLFKDLDNFTMGIKVKDMDF